MTVEVVSPTESRRFRDARRLSFETEDGGMTVLPGHIAFVAAVATGIVMVEAEGTRQVLAVSEGTAVKDGDMVQLAVATTVAAEGLEDLAEAVRRARRRAAESGDTLARLVGRMETELARKVREAAGS